MASASSHPADAAAAAAVAEAPSLPATPASEVLASPAPLAPAPPAPPALAPPAASPASPATEVPASPAPSAPAPPVPPAPAPPAPAALAPPAPPAPALPPEGPGRSPRSRPDRRCPNGESMIEGLSYQMNWSKRDFKTFRDLHGSPGLRLMIKNARGCTYSTACSGIDAPGKTARAQRTKVISRIRVNCPPDRMMCRLRRAKWQKRKSVSFQ